MTLLPSDLCSPPQHLRLSEHRLQGIQGNSEGIVFTRRYIPITLITFLHGFPFLCTSCRVGCERRSSG